MMKTLNHGDLAYVPSSVTLWQTNNFGSPSKTKTTTRPNLVLIADTNVDASRIINGERKVLFAGEYWMVASKNLYPCGEERQTMKACHL